MNLFFLSLIKTNEVFVILGGSGASNFNNYTYEATNENVFSYNSGWVKAESPMLGGDGNLGSPWAQLGNNLNIQTGQDIFFIDCARIGAKVTDWSLGGQYYTLANQCLDFAGNFSENYSVLWQEGSQDNDYSYNSNYFIHTILGLMRPNSDWLLSISTYSDGSQNRFSKLNDIVYLTKNYENIFLGANLDGQCLGDPPYNQEQVETLVELWDQSIKEKEKPYFINSIYNSCGIWRPFSDFFLLIGISMMIIFLCLGCYYSREYYSRRRYYISIQDNDNI